MTTASVIGGASAPQHREDPTGRPAEDAPAPGPEGSRSLADRIADARAMVAYQPLGGGVRLAFKVRPVSVAEAAQAGALSIALQRAIGRKRQPDPEDMTGLQAAELDAAQGTEEDQLDRALGWIEHGKRIARICATHVEDIDEPGRWRRLLWVDDPDDQGDDEVDGEPVTRLHLETVLTAEALMNISGAATRLIEEVADRWGRFRR
jgi:hypothetical protein